MESSKHPCLSCGACCAYYRVSFYWREAEVLDSPNPVPNGLFEEASGLFRCMKGTNEKRGNRCIALQGKVGEGVQCGIYEYRPSPCRDFDASFSKGERNKRCDEARAAHRLPPLSLKDWLGLENPLNSASEIGIEEQQNFY